MKKLILLPLIAILSFTSCDKNDDEQTDPVISTDGFTYHKNDGTTQFFETPNMYLEIDVDDDDIYPGVPDYYSFIFLNGRMFDNDADVNGSTSEYLFSTNTTNFARIQIEPTVNTSLSTGIPPSTGNTYVSGSSDDVVAYGFQVNSLSTPYYLTLNGTQFEFGEADENTGTVHLPASLGHSITINAMNLDSNNPSNSTIDVDYTFVNTSGEAFIGHYEGTLGVIED